ncbi:MAG: CehA/McbA family metallohydrolase [Acidobacteriota bacterium]
MKKKCLILFACFYLSLPAFTSAGEWRWFKGNTHCHTNRSDGDVHPLQVVRWYQEHDYHFIVITDHNTLTDVSLLDQNGSADGFILIPGIEVSDASQGKPVHLNAINIHSDLKPQTGKDKVETLQNNIEAIRAAGAVPQINHPNWLWAFDHIEMSQLTQVPLLEIYNMSFNCNNFGAGGKPGMEEIWDNILSKGIVLYGVAADDAHDYTGEFNSRRSNPGTCWIMVRAEELTPDSIVRALETGDFYSTVGILLKDIRITNESYTISIDPVSQMHYTTTFIGENGRILKEDYSLEPSYTLKGDELYVRARIFASSGEFACTQPYFPEKKSDDRRAPRSD